MKYIKFVFSIILKLMATVLNPSKTCHAADTETYAGLCERDWKNPKIPAKPGFAHIPEIFVRGKIEYAEMVEECTIFVDKSLLIKKFLETKQKVILITGPPETGKSINLSMLKAFFEIRVKGSQKRILPQTEMSTYKFFTKGIVTLSLDSPLQADQSESFGNYEGRNLSYYFVSNWGHERYKEVLSVTYKNPPIISKHKDIIDKYLGKYPVLRFDVIGVWHYVPTIYENLKEEISELYSKHVFVKVLIRNVIASNTTSDEEKKIAQEDLNIFKIFIREFEFFDTNLTETDFENSVLTLSRIMHRYVGKPVIILIDDYTPLLEHYVLDKKKDGYYGFKNDTMCEFRIKKDIQLMRNFMRKTLSENPYLEKAVINGVLLANKKDLFADVTDYVHYNAIDNDLQEFYGFTENEVQILFDYFKLNETTAKKARDFYKGYTIKPNTNLTMYNIRSIVFFLNERKMDNYWVQWAMTSDRMARLPDIRSFKKVLQPLIDGDDRLIRFIGVDYDMRDLLLTTRYTYNRKFDNMTETTINLSLSIFLELGLLTISNGGCNGYGTNSTHICVRIPNEEIKQAIKKCLEDLPKLF